MRIAFSRLGVRYLASALAASLALLGGHALLSADFSAAATDEGGACPDLLWSGSECEPGSGGAGSGSTPGGVEETQYEREHRDEIEQLDEEITQGTAGEAEAERAYDAQVAKEELERRDREAEERERSAQEYSEYIHNETPAEREAREKWEEAETRDRRDQQRLLEAGCIPLGPNGEPIEPGQRANDFACPWDAELRKQEEATRKLIEGHRRMEERKQRQRERKRPHPRHD